MPPSDIFKTTTITTTTTTKGKNVSLLASFMDVLYPLFYRVSSVFEPHQVKKTETPSLSLQQPCVCQEHCFSWPWCFLLFSFTITECSGEVGDIQNSFWTFFETSVCQSEQVKAVSQQSSLLLNWLCVSVSASSSLQKET